MRVPPITRKLAVAALLIAASAFAQAAERGVEPSVSASSGTAAVGAPARFRIGGDVTELYPGVRTRLRLTLRNPNPFPIRVTRIRTTVRSRDAACPARTVRVGVLRTDRRVAASGVARVQVQVRMRRGAPQACVAQRYRLGYRGRAVRA